VTETATTAAASTIAGVVPVFTALVFALVLIVIGGLLGFFAGRLGSGGVGVGVFVHVNVFLFVGAALLGLVAWAGPSMTTMMWEIAEGVARNVGEKGVRGALIFKRRHKVPEGSRLIDVAY
jgi:hypothetical protein